MENLELVDIPKDIYEDVCRISDDPEGFCIMSVMEMIDRIRFHS